MLGISVKQIFCFLLLLLSRAFFGWVFFPVFFIIIHEVVVSDF